MELAPFQILPVGKRASPPAEPSSAIVVVKERVVSKERHWPISAVESHRWSSVISASPEGLAPKTVVAAPSAEPVAAPLRLGYTGGGGQQEKHDEADRCSFHSRLNKWRLGFQVSPIFAANSRMLSPASRHKLTPGFGVSL
jgi:hypothetical protein